MNPTASHLFAAICLGALGFFVSGLIVPLLPESTDFGYFAQVNLALGVLCGWVVMGPRAGRGWVAGINNGLTGMAVMVLWGLFLQGAVEMFRLANRMRYDDPFEALAAIFTIALDYFFIMAVPSVLGSLFVGGILTGLVVEQVSRHWK